MPSSRLSTLREAAYLPRIECGEPALNLFGVTVHDAHITDLGVPDIETVVLRDLAAICGPTDYRASEPDDESVQRHSRVVTAYAARGPVLPAPVGVVFRSGESVTRWLELHYGALTDALSFVENRIAARVHIWRPGTAEEREVGADLANVAAESLRVLRASAIATLPLRTGKVTGLVLSAAFLLEQDLWNAFAAEVASQGQKAPSMRFELTGPWPPYDFVQMQLGA